MKQKVAILIFAVIFFYGQIQAASLDIGGDSGLNIKNTNGDAILKVEGEQVLTSRDVNAFYAYRVSDQTIGSGTEDIVEFYNEDFSNPDYDTAFPPKFSPSLPGKYFLTARVRLGTPSNQSHHCVSIHKDDGTTVALIYKSCSYSGGTQDISVSGIVEAVPGESFYVKYSHNVQGARPVASNKVWSYFQGYQIE